MRWTFAESKIVDKLNNHLRSSILSEDLGGVRFDYRRGWGDGLSLSEHLKAIENQSLE